MTDPQLAGVWDIIHKHGEKLNQILDLAVKLTQMREADKEVIEQLGATVEIFDARIQMLSAKVDELEARLRGPG